MLTTATFCAFVFSALLLPPKEDAFPLSRYPMFAVARPQLEALPYAFALLEDGTQARLKAELWASGGGVSNARNELARVAKMRPADRLAFCKALAARVVASGESFAVQAQEIRVVMGFFDQDRLVRHGDLTPKRVEPIARCPTE